MTKFTAPTRCITDRIGDTFFQHGLLCAANSKARSGFLTAQHRVTIRSGLESFSRLSGFCRAKCLPPSGSESSSRQRRRREDCEGTLCCEGCMGRCSQKRCEEGSPHAVQKALATTKGHPQATTGHNPGTQIPRAALEEERLGHVRQA